MFYSVLGAIKDAYQSEEDHVKILTDSSSATTQINKCQQGVWSRAGIRGILFDESGEPVEHQNILIPIIEYLDELQAEIVRIPREQNKTANRLAKNAARDKGCVSIKIDSLV